MSLLKRPDPRHPFMEGQVILNIGNGIVETLRMMAEVEATFERPFAVKNWVSPTDVSVFLRLDSGDHRGLLQFHFNKNTAKLIIDKMTDSDIALDSDELLDGVGEISNIFYGAAKTKLNQIGFNLKMTIPKACWTKNLPLSTTETTCMLIPFKVLGELCYVEIIIN